jgi:hypothetical protein
LFWQGPLFGYRKKRHLVIVVIGVIGRRRGSGSGCRTKAAAAAPLLLLRRHDVVGWWVLMYDVGKTTHKNCVSGPLFARVVCRRDMPFLEKIAGDIPS